VRSEPGLGGGEQSPTLYWTGSDISCGWRRLSALIYCEAQLLGKEELSTNCEHEQRAFVRNMEVGSYC
jgi:hypothetical protein